MAEQAGALLALWNDVEPQLEAPYNDWHAHEHVPQRLTVPGILWGWRFGRVLPAPMAGPMPKYLTLYGLRDAAVLASAPYLQLLREPTPASRAMRPALLRVSRWVCTLLTPGNIGNAQRVAARTFPQPPAPMANGARSGPASACGPLWARRLPDAPPLPWLSSQQSEPHEAVAGDWLQVACCAEDEAMNRARIDGAVVYDRLPPGPDTHRGES